MPSAVMCGPALCGPVLCGPAKNAPDLLIGPFGTAWDAAAWMAGPTVQPGRRVMAMDLTAPHDLNH